MSLSSWIAARFKHLIYPRVKDVRGAWRLRHTLDSISLRKEPRRTGTPESIFEAGDWDNLLILDDCRYDTYKEVTGRDGSRTSLGSCTLEFIRKTFGDGDFSDTVYVTANPHLHASQFETKTGRTAEETFAEVKHLYLTDWDDEAGVVLPSTVRERAVEAREEHPEKRMIVHFMQPHVPLLVSDLTPERTVSTEEAASIESDSLSVMARAELGEVEESTVRTAYRRNLEAVMEEVDPLVEQLPGKTVITSDHGELLGEGGRYGHPCRMDLEILRKVPWDER
ncbi:MAG: hypothetical protein SVS85_04375 [Candidatus Nanohaloarchaea archaeon]|nr:hypothetical protein [Candidatus Nanohaloarchaea archaeon]